ncbi:heptosyltransferase-1 [Mariprofundus ferrinatatus]|uniref:Lipopolysaccharide heptosyltransferase 1 n=1 Tax=Mariprofundus ferrinatatus TaxID=1921087 RepID=A0A2K8L3Y9_9PROT|nr:lipopolysaccharide heptosyltransferase I [Mariprofundus ferrinatatus]ATX82045.1 heptosyltransferase-1 [Mariprofundus ferrinatatus]
MKILIVRLSAFGDIIHCLPALDDLLARPEVTEVHWLVDERYKFVTDILPKQVHVHAVALKGDHPIHSAWKAIRTLRATGFGAVIDLQGLIKSAVLSRLCGSPVYGFDNNLMREKPASLLLHNVTFHPDERHVVQQYRRIATGPFTSEPASVAIPYAKPSINLADSRCPDDGEIIALLGLEEKSYVILHAAGGWETKQLPASTWISVAKGLKEKNITPLFTWGNDAERAQAESYADRSNGFALPKRLTMPSLCSLILHARAVVGADTGMLHLTAALGKPTVTFWGPSASWRSAPLEVEHDMSRPLHLHIESNPACGPCFKRTCDNFVCMDMILPESILRAIDEL